VHLYSAGLTERPTLTTDSELRMQHRVAVIFLFLSSKFLYQDLIKLNRYRKDYFINMMFKKAKYAVISIESLKSSDLIFENITSLSSMLNIILIKRILSFLFK